MITINCDLYNVWDMFWKKIGSYVLDAAWTKPSSFFFPKIDYRLEIQHFMWHAISDQLNLYTDWFKNFY